MSGTRSRASARGRMAHLAMPGWRPAVRDATLGGLPPDEGGHLTWLPAALASLSQFCSRFQSRVRPALEHFESLLFGLAEVLDERPGQAQGLPEVDCESRGSERRGSQALIRQPSLRSVTGRAHRVVTRG